MKSDARAGDADSQGKRPGGDGGVFSPGGRVSADGTEFIQELPSSLDFMQGLTTDPVRAGPPRTGQEELQWSSPAVSPKGRES